MLGDISHCAMPTAVEEAVELSRYVYVLVVMQSALSVVRV